MKSDQAEAQPRTPGHKVQGFISAPLIVTKLTQLLTVNVKQQMIKKTKKQTVHASGYSMFPLQTVTARLGQWVELPALSLGACRSGIFFH